MSISGSQEKGEFSSSNTDLPSPTVKGGFDGETSSESK